MLLYFKLFALFLLPASCVANPVTICTYNIWNVMFSWEIRMQHFAQMVGDAGCEILVLQEVRIHGDRSWSQAAFLQRLLPRFQWVYTRQADRVSKPPNSYWAGFEVEGLAVLSMLPTIGEVHSQHLSRVHGPDTNQRIALHVPVTLASGHILNVVAVHLSYHRQQQCQNAVEVQGYIQENNLQHVVIAGDFNAYPDFPDPVDLLLGKGDDLPNKSNKCPSRLTSPGATPLRDAWDSVNPSLPGYTFSNMPEPGLNSRPDRMLVSRDLTPLQVRLEGEGGAYGARRSRDVWWLRAWRALGAARDSYPGKAGFSCLHDCGPHGICRCGVCVSKGDNYHSDSDRCLLPDCPECSSRIYLQSCCFTTVLTVLLAVSGMAAVKVLVVASRMDQSDAFFVLGCTCCLCNPRLLRGSAFSPRSFLGRLFRGLGLGRLPPAPLLLLALTLGGLWLGAAVLWFSPLLNTVGTVLPEELFPSDHLMIVAQLEVQ